RAAYWLQEMGLENFADHRPGELSGGQQQRVAIARALVGDPGLVLADEPTANLDSATGEAIITLMKHLNQKKGITFLLSTHDERIIRYASRIIHLLDGRIVS
ncbi:MAG: ATP-binding cassette domain-containing protein, partial [bacterium]